MYILQNHTAIGRALAVLTDAYGVTFARNVHSAYLHFEALVDHDYSFTCALCGFYPHIMVLDGHKKCAFRLHGNVQSVYLNLCSLQYTSLFIAVVTACNQSLNACIIAHVCCVSVDLLTFDIFVYNLCLPCDMFVT